MLLHLNFWKKILGLHLSMIQIFYPLILFHFLFVCYNHFQFGF